MIGRKMTKDLTLHHNERQNRMVLKDHLKKQWQKTSQIQQKT